MSFFKDPDGYFSIIHSKSENTDFIDAHTHKNYELYYFLSGDVTYYIEGHVYELNPNDILLINNREVHKPIINSSKTYERFVINFDFPYTGTIDSNYNLLYCFDNRKLGQLNKIDGKFVREMNLDTYVRNTLTYIKSDVIEDKLLARTYFTQLLLLINKIFKQEKEKFSKGYTRDDKIDQVLNYINKNLNNKLTLDIIENTCFVNKYYLSHLFKETTGLTVMDYIAHKRILLAKNLLTSGLPATQVAQETGFNDYSNFYKTFKKLEGISPFHYKKTHKE